MLCLLLPSLSHGELTSAMQLVIMRVECEKSAAAAAAGDRAVWEALGDRALASLQVGQKLCKILGSECYKDCACVTHRAAG